MKRCSCGYLPLPDATHCPKCGKPLSEQTFGVWLTCVECGDRCAETWDDRCCGCFYVYTGGDQGEDDWWSRHSVVRDGTVYAEVK